MTEYTRESLGQTAQTWLDRIAQAEKREVDWCKDAEVAEAAFLAGQTDDPSAVVPDWNILHSNVETIVPAIYNSTPAPDIRPRHAQRDEILRHVADAYERAIAAQIDDNRLDAEMEALAQDVFVAGRGILRQRFDSDLEDIVEVFIDPETGEQYEEVTGQRVVNERIVYENVAWRDYREGPAKRWAEVPWVAFRHFISQSELERIRDEELWQVQNEDRKPDAEGEEKDVDVWEIWCRDTGKVYFIAKDSALVIAVEDDPLGLPGFFPIAEPVQPITATGSRIPVCPYSIYKKQAEELNRVTKRINAIMSGLKVRGGIAAAAEGIQDIARAGDNELVPIHDVEGLAASGGIEGAIVWWPIDKAIVVLRELYTAREQIKQSIYEITGISDIIRGQGAASETATAQQIKTEWGSLRVKKMQRMIERQVRDVFVITAEIMSRHFGPEAILRVAGMQPEPQLMQALAGGLDHYRIDVESDSTARVDSSKRREEMSRFLEGTAQFFGVMAPLVAQAPQSAGVVAEIYGAFSAQFNLGKSSEDAIEQLVQLARQQGEQPPPNPEAEAKKAEQQFKMQEMQGEMQIRQAELQLEGQKIALEREKLAIEREKLAIERAQMGMQTQPGVAVA